MGRSTILILDMTTTDWPMATWLLEMIANPRPKNMEYAENCVLREPLDPEYLGSSYNSC